MANFFGGSKIIKVNVANGSTGNIWCRVAGDKALKTQEERGGGFDVHGIGVNAHKAEQTKYVAGATRGYTHILRGNSLEFELSTSSDSVYMTIIKDSGSKICKNHEISRSRNYVITNRGALLDAKKKKRWIDTDGGDHTVSNYYIDDYDTKKDDSDDTNCNPSEEFSENCW